MINILDSNINFDTIKKIHWEFMSCYVNRRLSGTECSHICERHCENFPNRKVSHKSIYFNNLESYILSPGRLEKIISGNPHELYKEHEDFESFVVGLFGQSNYVSFLNSSVKDRRTTKYKDLYKFFNDVAAVFNYEWFNSLSLNEKYNSYELTEALGIRACTYCNRAYTVTRRKGKNGKLMRPQLDHWFPKSKFPLLGVSFHNLIPCCGSCNSVVKGDLIMDIKLHVHPYIKETSQDDLTFDYYHSVVNDKYRIFLKKTWNSSGKMLNSAKFLQIDEMYNAHLPDLKDLIDLQQAYSENYIDSIAQFFPNSDFTKEEVYRILFGVELSEKDFFKRPFSKFKRDILKELGIIKD